MEHASDDLTEAIDRLVAELGFELVDVRKRVSRGRTMFQIRIDREGSAPGSGTTADDCAVVSRALEAWLDESEILGERYVLEVSSPGIERPIRFPKHWQRYVGREIRLKVKEKGRIKATIVSVPESGVVLLRAEHSGEEFTVPIKDVSDATLVVDWSEVDQSLTRTVSKESQ